MKIETGKEAYALDHKGLIKNLQTDCWNEFSEKLCQNLEVSHKLSRLLAFTLKALDRIMHTPTLSGAHYFLIRKNKAETLEQR